MKKLVIQFIMISAAIVTIIQYFIDDKKSLTVTQNIQSPIIKSNSGTINYNINNLISRDKVSVKKSIPEYAESYIPLVYSDISKFKNFLKDNIGNVVKINSQISFDVTLPESILTHQVCNFDDFIEAVKYNPSNVANVTLGFPKFSRKIKEANLNYVYDNKLKKEVFEKDTYGLVKCLDQIRIIVKDPRSLRLSYGGTGTISLPLWGKFLVELRAYSGPSSEYTLREL